jgi:hypothetical protein
MKLVRWKPCETFEDMLRAAEQKHRRDPMRVTLTATLKEHARFGSSQNAARRRGGKRTAAEFSLEARKHLPRSRASR